MARWYEETFKSPEKETERDALRVLESIRSAHPVTSGWEEMNGYVMQLSNGKWIAVRHHRKPV